MASLIHFKWSPHLLSMIAFYLSLSPSPRISIFCNCWLQMTGFCASWFHVVVMLIRCHFICRLMVERVQENQISMENKGITVFFICLIFGFIAFARLLVDIVLSVYRAYIVQRTEESRKFCWMSSSWLFLLFNCCIIILILSL